jgi:PAS domain S-box-containing protein
MTNVAPPDRPALVDSILESASDAIVATDRSGCIRFWNPGAVRIFGFPIEEAVGQSLDLIIPENLRKRHWDGYHRVMATGKSQYGPGDLLSVPARTRDGRRIFVEFTITMVFDEASRPVGTIAILRDVTERVDELRKLRREAASARSAS